jgi:hypothetical protein
VIDGHFREDFSMAHDIPYFRLISPHIFLDIRLKSDKPKIIAIFTVSIIAARIAPFKISLIRVALEQHYYCMRQFLLDFLGLKLNYKTSTVQNAYLFFSFTSLRTA